MEKNKLNLPVTRKALFFDVIKNRFGLLFKTGALILLFFIPLIVNSLVFDQFILSIYNTEGMVVDNVLTSEANQLYRSYELYRMIFNLLGFIILSIGLSGVIRIYRQMCWSEGVLFWDCFKKGVKQNYKNYIGFALIFDFLYASIKLSELFSNNLVIFGIVVAIVFLVFLPILIIMMVYSSIYNASFPRIVKNSAILMIRNYPYMLLLSFLMIAFIALSYIPVPLTLIRQGIYVIVILLIVPLYILLSFNISNYMFDKDINKNNHPEMLRKGLY